MKSSNLLLSVLLCLSIRCYSATITVNSEGTGDYPDIQEAVEAAEAGDIVVVADGIYVGNGNKNIDFLGKSITVRSENGPAGCIIDCEGDVRGFRFISGEGRDSVVDGFTIVNGLANGGGIRVNNDSGPVIQNCVIRDCEAFEFGGGIYCGPGSDALIRNCRLINNNAPDGGGGIYCEDILDGGTTNITIEGCEIAGNNGGTSGGGLYGKYCGQVYITGSTFTGNECSLGGGGIRVYSSAYTGIRNSIFTENESREGSGGGVRIHAGRFEVFNSMFRDNVCSVYGGGIRSDVGVFAEIVNCTFIGNDAGGGRDIDCSGNTAVTNSAFEDTEYGSIEGDPFVSYCIFRSERDFGQDGPMLSADGRPLAGSPCIDAGNNAAVDAGSTDLDGNERIINGVVDIGAYEYTGVSSLMVSPTMFNFGAYHGQPDAVSGEVVLTSDYPISDVDWILVEKDDLISIKKTYGTGTVPAGGFDTIAFSINVSGLGVGYYAASFAVAPASDPDDRQRINVYLKVVDPLMVPGEYSTIQDAVDAASYGDIVVVSDGVYTGSGNTNVSFVGKAITVRSENVAGNCVIDCERETRGFRFVSGEGRDSVLAGFSIINGFANESGGIRIKNGSGPVIQNCVIRDCESTLGGGIYCGPGSDALIRNCRVINNNAEGEGGGIYCGGTEEENASITIEGCEIIGNNSSGSSGGGLYAEYCREVSISDSRFMYNESSAAGGGIRVSVIAYVNIHNSIFAENRTGDGSGGGARVAAERIRVSDCIFRDNYSGYAFGGGIRTTTEGFTEIVNCTFVGNEADRGGGASCSGGSIAVVNSIFKNNTDYAIEGSGYVVIRHCVFKQNPDGAYYHSGSVYSAAGINELAGCYGNSNPEPLLTANGHLQGGSPCVDGGDPARDYSGQSDIDGENRVYGGAADIGADEFIDIDGDGLADRWEIKFFGSTANGAAGEDSDGDGKINLDEYNDSTNPVGPYYVAVNGNDAWDGIAAEWDGVHGPKATIQAAIDVTFDGDMVVIGDGTYTGWGNRDITFRGKAITVRSANGPYECIIDCEGSEGNSHRGFIFESYEDADSVLEGVTITNGHYYSTFLDSSGGSAGGGILCSYSGPTINRCIIKNCYAGGGSAIYVINFYYWEYSYLSAKSPVIKNCLIAGNKVYGGGAIQFEYAGGAVIENCTITENISLGYGNQSGAVAFWEDYSVWDGYSTEETSSTIRNTTIYNNYSVRDDYDYQVSLFGLGSTLVVENSDIEGGFDGIYVFSSTLEWGEGNIDENPSFVDAGFWNSNEEWVEGDYHLRAISPCINAGDPSGDYTGQTDIDGEERQMGGRVDIGADEVLMYDGPYLFVSPAELVFNIYEGEPESASQELEISNRGSGGFYWQIAEDCPWLNVDKLSGTISGLIAETTNLSVLGSGLGVGSYTYQLVVSAAEAQNEQQVVEIMLNVKDPLLVPSEYPTIQAAVDAADDGDMVVVEDGVYTGEGNKNINFTGKAIIVRSMNGAENCVIDCQEEYRGFVFVFGEGRDSVLDGFTIINGNVSWGGGIRIGTLDYDYRSGPTIENCVIENCQAEHGGGISCGVGCDALIRKCRIINNNATEIGGGIYCEGYEGDTAYITIEECEISNNSSDSAGGFYAVYYQRAFISNSTFTGNESFWGGGGAAIFESVDVEINRCIFGENVSTGGSGGGARVAAERTKISNSIFRGNICSNYGGGVRVTGGLSSEVLNCTFVDNTANNVGGGFSVDNNGAVINSIFKDNSSYSIHGEAVIKHCIFDSNGGHVLYDPGSDLLVYTVDQVNDLEGCYGNLDDDPLLSFDLHPEPGSPCIDAGENSSVIGPFDLEGNPRITDGDGDWEAVVDIGAYESPSAVHADIDGSGRVDYLDFGLFSSEWLVDNMQLFEYEESAWWPLDEGFGTTVHDLSIYGHDGTLSYSAPRWTTSDLNGVLIFDGISNYVEVVGYKGVTGTQSRTCTAWVKTPHASGIILSWGDTLVDGARWVFRTDATGALRVSVGGGNIIGSEIITDDQWHFVAAVLEDDGSPNADEIKLYVDGVEDTNTTFVSHEITEGTTNADVLIGAFYYAGSYYYYEGIIDDVRIYEFALSDEMIELIHNRQSPSRLVCTEYPQADVNHDCAVDVDDLRIFAEKWLWQQ